VLRRYPGDVGADLTRGSGSDQRCGCELAPSPMVARDHRGRFGDRSIRRLAPLAAQAKPVTYDVRERAWAAIHDALAQLAGWAVGPCVYHGEEDLWHVTAVDLRPRGRQAKREAITATGTTEVSALRALAALLEARQISGR
jgi:hypothetical protein